MKYVGLQDTKGLHPQEPAGSSHAARPTKALGSAAVPDIRG
jgi:hypothetical protein